MDIKLSLASLKFYAQGKGLTPLPRPDLTAGPQTLPDGGTTVAVLLSINPHLDSFDSFY